MIRLLEAAQMAIVELGIARPKLVLFAALIATVFLGAAILRVEVDTDLENILSSSNPCVC